MSETPTKQLIEDAADAHTRLNTFYAVIALMEGGLLPGGSDAANETAQTIIGLCKDQAQLDLEEYDKTVARLVSEARP